eukprot:jgi/Mesen1/9015/ME000565S08342
MQLIIYTSDERLVMIEVEADEQVENIKAILEVETLMPLAQQRLIFQDKELQNSERLISAGVRDGDMIRLVAAPSQPQGRGREAREAIYNPDGSARDPAAFLAQIKGDSQLMGRLWQENPPMAKAVAENNVEELQRILRAIHKHVKDREMEELALATADPFDVEAQRKIEEAIRQACAGQAVVVQLRSDYQWKNVDENYETAMEFSPEVFTQVPMLYVLMEVNNLPIKAFVDSGAQMTNMSLACAERCGLMRLVDKRFQGIARGVGTSKIIGRIHAVQLKIGPNFYMCSITVLDSLGNDFLFGLDMLRKHQCCIDLQDNVLRVGRGEIAAPFLAEKDIPVQEAHEEDKMQTESTGAPSASASTSQQPPASVGNSNAASPSPSAPPAQPAPAQAATNTLVSSSAPPPSESEMKIIRLMELGFDRQAVIEALSVCDGNEDHAAGILFG